MRFNVVPTEIFKKEAKRLINKYPSLKQELADLSGIFQLIRRQENPWVSIPTRSDSQLRAREKEKRVEAG